MNIHMYMNKNVVYTNKRPCTKKPSYQPKPLTLLITGLGN